MQQAPTRPGRRTHSGLVVMVATAACLTVYAFSRFTGWVSELVVLPVGSLSLAVALLLVPLVPGSTGLHWGATGSRWRLVLGAVLAVGAVTAAFRLTGSVAPYESSFGEFVLVPLGEELLFRGVLLGVLVEVFRRGLVGRAQGLAVLVSALAFGAGHLGNLGYVDPQFVVLQVAVATVFGLAAGWMKVATGSLVGPVALHATMNVVAVV